MSDRQQTSDEWEWTKQNLGDPKMTDDEAMIGQAREVKSCMIPGALSREQVEKMLSGGVFEISALLDTDAAQRATIAQQAQEIEQAKRGEAYCLQEKERILSEFCQLQVKYGAQKHEIRDLVQKVERLTADLKTAQIEVANRAHFEQDLSRKLAAMEQERDEQCKSNVSLQVQLVTAEARCKEVEKQRDELNKVCNYHEKLEADMLEKYTQLQATLAAREARIKELEEWQEAVIGSGTDQEMVIMMAADKYTKSVAQEWKEHTKNLQATLAAREAELERLKNDPDYQQCCELRDAARQDAARLRKALEYCHAYFTGHLRPEHNSPLAVIEAALKET